MLKGLVGAVVLGASVFAATPVFAAVTYGDKATFLAATGATQATTPYPNTGNGQNLGLNSGTVSFHAVAESSYTTGYLYFSPVSVRLPGNVISINAFEDLDAAFSTSVRAFGFDFHEPEFDPGLGDTFQDSTFTVTLLMNAVAVDSFTFNAPNDVAAFVGASSSSAFNNVQIRETIGGVENEFFGQFYTAQTLVPQGAVPEPAAWSLMLLGFGLVGAALRRREVGASIRFG
jgi:hypothetical protein